MDINQSRKLCNLVLGLFFSLFFFACTNNNSANNYNHDNGIGSIYYQQYPKSYQPYKAPRSGIYNNPYKSPPLRYYPYYDYDYYYIPPSDYRNVEPSYGNGPDATKF